MSSRWRVRSWNVNGLRSVADKGFVEWLKTSRAHVVGLQETRATPEQVPEAVRTLRGWKTHFVAAERKGYSGVGLYAKRPFDEIVTSLGDTEMDAEGRVQIARFGRLWIANVYFPNGSGKDRSNDRVPFKLAFYRKLFATLEPLRAHGGRVLVMGDFNTAPEAIDLARPKSNEKTSGFLPEERDEVRRWCDAGWADTFRSLHPTREGAYSWWSQRFGVREKNVGWRIDLVLASEGAMPFVRAATIHPEVTGSDHCPVGVELDASVLD